MKILSKNVKWNLYLRCINDNLKNLKIETKYNVWHKSQKHVTLTNKALMVCKLLFFKRAQSFDFKIIVLKGKKVDQVLDGFMVTLGLVY